MYLTTADCTRQALLAAAEKYVAAQQLGTLDLSSLPASPSFSYMETNAARAFASSVLSQPLKIEYHRSITDTVACASYTEFVALAPHPYVVGIRRSATTRHNMSVVLIDSIAATTGALSFNAVQDATVLSECELGRAGGRVVVDQGFVVQDDGCVLRYVDEHDGC
jgi:hypothetical protein